MSAQIPPTMPPDRMTPTEVNDLQAAARLARTLWPNAVGELLHRELEWAAQGGYRLDQSGLTRRLVAAVEDEQRRRAHHAARAVLAELDQARHWPRVWLEGDEVPAGVWAIDCDGRPDCGLFAGPSTKGPLVEWLLPDFAAAVAAERERRAALSAETSPQIDSPALASVGSIPPRCRGSVDDRRPELGSGGERGGPREGSPSSALDPAGSRDATGPT